MVWESVRLEAVLDALIDYRGKTPTKTASGVRLITAKVIKGGFIDDSSFEYVAEADYDDWMRRGLPRGGDLLVTTEAPLGEVARVPEDRIALAQRVILLRTNPQKIDQRYLFHAFKSSFVQAELRKRATGTTVLGIKQSELRQIQVPAPPLPTQRRIAEVLSAYDDLIEINSRRIKILEEMARSLDREWFVDFRFPGHENVKFVERDDTRRPADWALHRLGARIEFAYGKALKEADRKSGTTPVYGSSGIVGWHDESLAGGPGIIVGRKGNVGSVHWSPVAFFAIDTVFFVRTDLPLRYVYFNLQRQNFLNNDAAVPGLNRNQAYALPLLVPPARLLEEFERATSAFLEPADLLRRANERLRDARDLILPRLISGEIELTQ